MQQLLEKNLRASKFITINIVMLSIVLLSSSLITFTVANWSEINPIYRFIIFQAVLIFSGLGCIGLSYYFSFEKINSSDILYWSNLSLTLICMSAIGGLLALVGITYQTGADSWPLFALWSAISLPLALYKNQNITWAFWLIILNATMHLIGDQLFSNNNASLLLPSMVSLCIYLYLSRVKKTTWLTHVLLVTSQLIYYKFLYLVYFDGFAILIFSTLLTLLIGLEIYNRKSLIDFIINGFFMLILINNMAIKYIMHISPTNNALIIDISLSTVFLISSSLLFFKYLRYTYVSWRKKNLVISNETDLMIRKTLKICKLFVGISISLMTILCIIILIESFFSNESSLYIISFLLISLLFLQTKILPDSLLTQITCSLVYITLSIFFCFSIDIDSHQLSTQLIASLSLSILLFSILFLVGNNITSRFLSSISIALAIIPLLLILILMPYNLLIVYISIVCLPFVFFYLLTPFVIFGENKPKPKLLKIFPFGMIPIQAWWFLLILNGFFFLAGFIINEINQYTNLFFMSQPIYALGLIIKNNKLPNDTRFKIGLIILIVTGYFFFYYTPILNYVLSLIFISVALRSRIGLFFTWLTFICLLISEYYLSSTLLFDKSIQLAISGFALLGFSLLLGYFVKQMHYDLDIPFMNSSTKIIQYDNKRLNEHHTDTLNKTVDQSPSNLTFLSTKKIKIVLVMIGVITTLFITNMNIMLMDIP